jgi:hypothetical protein
MFLKSNENIKLAHWVINQRKQYRLHLEGEDIVTTHRIQALELGFGELLSGTAHRTLQAMRPSATTCVEGE